jgi:hypothetical protein
VALAAVGLKNLESKVIYVEPIGTIWNERVAELSIKRRGNSLKMNRASPGSLTTEGEQNLQYPGTFIKLFKYY